MNGKSSRWLIVVAVFLGVGCENTAPPSTAQRLPAPPAETQNESAPANPTPSTRGATDLASPALTEQPAAPAFPAAGTGGGITQQAFRAAHERVMAISIELLGTLDDVADEASAQAAAPKLSQLTPQWKNAAEAATAAFLALPEEQRSAAMQEAMLSSITELEKAGAAHGSDTTSQIERIAKSPGGPVLQNELVALRDAFLTTRGPYSPVTARRRIEEKLGPVGSPIKSE